MMEMRGHNTYFCTNILVAGGMKPKKLKRRFEIVHAKCVGRHLNFSIEK
jgi:hypothetical protein